MLEKQEQGDSCEVNVNFSLEPEVQIKEEKDFLELPFSQVTIKKELEDPVEFDDIHTEGLDYASVKNEREDSISEGETAEEEQENEVTPELVLKFNEDTKTYVRKRWSSLIRRTGCRSLSFEDEKESDWVCRMCRLNFETETDLVAHEKTHSDGIFQCNECDQVFDREFSLKIHQSFHGALRRHKCHICDKSFTRRSTLNDHTLSHSGEKPYQCDVCKKYYRSKISLASHFRYHFKAKKYECPVCKKLFFQPSGLSEHLRMHRNAKDYKCNICSKHFSYKSTLKRHVKGHFGTERHPCDECDKYFKQSSSLLFHKRTKHLGWKPFKCEDCDKTFTRGWSLRLHMNSHRVLQMQNTIKIVSEKDKVV